MEEKRLVKLKTEISVIQNEIQRKKIFKNEKIISELQGNIRKSNKHVNGFLEGCKSQEKKNHFQNF